MLRLALIQLGVTTNKSQNVQRAVEFIAAAKEKGAHLAVLPVNIFKILKFLSYNLLFIFRNASIRRMASSSFRNIANQFQAAKRAKN